MFYGLLIKAENTIMSLYVKKKHSLIRRRLKKCALKKTFKIDFTLDGEKIISARSQITYIRCSLS